MDPLPNSNEAVLYLTFDFGRSVNLGKLTNYGVDSVLDDIIDNDILLDLDEKSIREILNLTKLHSNRGVLKWFPGHE